MPSSPPVPAPSVDERPRRRWRWPLRAGGARLRRAGSEEGGLSLIEVLVASALGLIVTGAVVSFLVTSQRQSLADIQRPEEAASAGEVLKRINHELRQAYAVVGTGSDWIDFLIRDSTSAGAYKEHRVLINCEKPSLMYPTNSAYHACYRYQSKYNSTQAANVIASESAHELLLDLVTNTSTEPVFTFQYPTGASKPDAGTTSLRVPENAGRPAASPYKEAFAYSEGFYMPNLNLTPQA